MQGSFNLAKGIYFLRYCWLWAYRLCKSPSADVKRLSLGAGYMKYQFELQVVFMFEIPLEKTTLSKKKNTTLIKYILPKV
jgi:hypothetical protein